MTTACMGGWCVKRDHCANYHATDRNEPAERMCNPKDHGAYIAINLRTAEPAEEEAAAMTLTQHTRRRVFDAIPAKGAPLRELAASSGVHISNVRMVVRLLEDEKAILTMRAGTGENSKHEVWAFTTEEAREEFQERWLDEVARRQKVRLDAKTAKRRAMREAEGRSLVAIAAERREARKRAKLQEEQARREAEAQALKKAQGKLRKQTAAAGATVFKGGTLAPKPKPSAWADLVPCNLDAVPVTVLECKLQSPFEAKPEEIQPLFSSLRPGQYIAPAPAWVEAVAA